MDTAEFLEFLIEKNGLEYVFTAIADGVSKLADKMREQGKESLFSVYNDASTELYIVRNEVGKRERELRIEYLKAKKAQK